MHIAASIPRITRVSNAPPNTKMFASLNVRALQYVTNLIIGIRTATPSSVRICGQAKPSCEWTGVMTFSLVQKNQRLGVWRENSDNIIPSPSQLCSAWIDMCRWQLVCWLLRKVVRQTCGQMHFFAGIFKYLYAILIEECKALKTCADQQFRSPSTIVYSRQNTDPPTVGYTI